LTYPDVLDDVPTAGRSVDWDAIDTAEIPTFGDTRPVAVRWAEEGREILADLEARRRESTGKAGCNCVTEQSQDDTYKESLHNTSQKESLAPPGF
jgi:hypothetical protein